MTEPVSKAIEIGDMEKILGIWEECAQDLKVSIDAEYAGSLDYPSQQRRYKRDVEVAMLSLSMIPAFRLKYNIEKYERR